MDDARVMVSELVANAPDLQAASQRHVQRVEHFLQDRDGDRIEFYL
ncbi:hypothetical protein ACH4E7_25740 [Kitasatospora sp. NPDC018058]